MRSLSSRCATGIVLFGLMTSLVRGQTSNTAILTWTAPTSYTDFSVIADPITYNVYSQVKGSSEVTRVASGLSTTSTQRSNIPNGSWCWMVTAVVKGMESARSAPVCKDFGLKTPSVVTNVKVS